MDYLGEIVALSIDGLVFFVCLKQYLKNRRVVNEIKGAPVYEISPELEKAVRLEARKKLPYAVVRGQVKAIGPPIDSSSADGVTGVIQKITFREHVVSKGAHGFWSDSKRIIQETSNSIPFVLMGKSGETKIEVLDADTNAEMLELTTIADKFQPTESSGIVEHVWGYFTGIRRRGIQTTEEMLKEGAIVTGVGEITLNTDGSNPTNPFDDIKFLVNVPANDSNAKPSFVSTDFLNSDVGLVHGLNRNQLDTHSLTANNFKVDQPSLRLHQPVKGGLPLIISHLPLPSLITRLEGKRKAFGWAAALLGVSGVVISCWIAFKWVRAKKEKLDQDERKRQRELERRQRRRLAREGNSSGRRDKSDELEEAQLCVVCRENPKELILMPCGHVCLCEDCYESISNKCPVCRAEVEKVSAAYIA
ncbi:mitochondrial E3 ubiquitin protein ligase 1-like isoform X1 [Ischnura elegans]|uniref:mitochondrial E3 ubiquitin protein ligase 1-like isoform X1 n=1 Tax=Ischnura elegans TaxID=197161 RepID=UPI001ED8BB1D|nr:mitochondrial E3 ubiquitin protein ligase 1-like isoform X1 [Ischnura elegans]